MKRSLLPASLAGGSLAPLAAAAVLAGIMPAPATWVLVVGVAVVAGAFAAWAGYEWSRLLVSVRDEITESTRTAQEISQEMRADTRAVQKEAGELLAQQLGRLFGEERKLAESQRQVEAKAIVAELVDMRKAFELATQAIQDTVQGIAMETQRQQEQRRNDLESSQSMLELQRQSHEAAGQRVIEKLSSTCTEISASVSSHIETTRAEERKFTEHQRQVRADVVAEELAEVTRTFESAAQTIQETVQGIAMEAQREQQEQRQADQESFQSMLELQQQSHEAAAQRSGQLWDRLLNRLK